MYGLATQAESPALPPTGSPPTASGAGCFACRTEWSRPCLHQIQRGKGLNTPLASGLHTDLLPSLGALFVLSARLCLLLPLCLAIPLGKAVILQCSAVVSRAVGHILWFPPFQTLGRFILPVLQMVGWESVTSSDQ